jgi:O-succinylbenzoate synthase
MKIGKPRHDPDKKQNKYGFWCQCAEEHDDGTITCEGNYGDTSICKGNPHNCVKTKYHRLASRSDRQKF